MFNFNFEGFLLFFGIICAIGGWLIIEGLLWVVSHIDIAWI